MTRADAERWDSRYHGRDVAAASRPEAVSDDLVASIPSSGTALDVACGAGGVAVWLAERGLKVTAIDVSPAAIKLTNAAADAAGLDDRVDAVVTDLDDDLPAAMADYDVIVCQRFRDPSLYGAFVDRLAVGGVSIVTVLSETGADAPSPFRAPSGELADAFQRDDCVVMHHSEGDGTESIIVRRLY